MNSSPVNPGIANFNPGHTLLASGPLTSWRLSNTPPQKQQEQNKRSTQLSNKQRPGCLSKTHCLALRHSKLWSNNTAGRKPTIPSRHSPVFAKIVQDQQNAKWLFGQGLVNALASPEDCRYLPKPVNGQAEENSQSRKLNQVQSRISRSERVEIDSQIYYIDPKRNFISLISTNSSLRY